MPSNPTNVETISPASTKRPLRIAIFACTYAPILDGVSIAVHGRVKWFLAHGHTVLLVHPNIDEQYSDEVRNRDLPGVEEFADEPAFSSVAYPSRPHPFGKDRSEPRSYRHWSDTAILREFKPDVVIADEATSMKGYTSFFLGGYRKSIAAEYCREMNIPRVVLNETDWVTYAERHFRKWVGRLLPFVWKLGRKPKHHSVTRTLFPSRILMDRYRQYGMQSTQYLPFHGIDCNFFHPEAVEDCPLPEPGRPTMLFVGRMAKDKNVDQLLDAFELVIAKVPDVRLVMVGKGLLFDHISKRAAAYPDNIIMWGEAFGNDLRGWYARADVFVNPSITEVFCTTNLQAMACGTPIVAADAGGNSEQVADGESGFLTRPNDPQHLAEQCIAILQSPETAERMQTVARQRSLAHDTDHCTQLLEDVLFEFIAEQRGVSVG